MPSFLAAGLAASLGPPGVAVARIQQQLKTGDTVGGEAGTAASKAIKDVCAEMAGYGVK